MDLEVGLLFLLLGPVGARSVSCHALVFGSLFERLNSPLLWSRLTFFVLHGTFHEGRSFLCFVFSCLPLLRALRNVVWILSYIRVGTPFYSFYIYIYLLFAKKKTF